MWLSAFLLALGALGALTIHELGHLLVARAFGINAVAVTIGAGPTVVKFTDRSGTCWRVRLLPFGSGCGFPDPPVSGQARAPDQRDGPRSIRSISLGRQAVMLLAGPLSNAALAGALFLATYIQDRSFSITQIGATEAGLPFLVGAFSIAVALFNLLPVFPLDGGRLTLLALEAITRREISRESESRLFTSGIVLLWIMSALAALLFIAVPILKYG